MAKYHEILGVGPNASAAEIRQAYRRGVLRWHPDRNPGNEDEATRRFKEIQEAYRVLGPPRHYAEQQPEQGTGGTQAEWARQQARQAQERARRMRQWLAGMAQEMARGGATRAEVETALGRYGLQPEELAGILREVRFYPWRIVLAWPWRRLQKSAASQSGFRFGRIVAVVFAMSAIVRFTTGLLPHESPGTGDDALARGVQARIDAAIRLALPQFDPDRGHWYWHSDGQSVAQGGVALRPDERDFAAEFAGAVAIDGPTTVYLFNSRPLHCADCSDLLVSAFATRLESGHERLVAPMGVLDRRGAGEGLKPFAFHAPSGDFSVVDYPGAPSVLKLRTPHGGSSDPGRDPWFRVEAHGIRRLSSVEIANAAQCGAACGDVVRAGERPPLLFRPPPEEVVYPYAARREGGTGSVMVRIQVSAAGLVLRTRIVSATPNGVFEESAQAYCREYRFAPASAAWTTDQEILYRLQ